MLAVKFSRRLINSRAKNHLVAEAPVGSCKGCDYPWRQACFGANTKLETTDGPGALPWSTGWS